MDNETSPYLAGKLLLAMPGLGDPRFHKAVILICTHDENGAMGLVVNDQSLNLSFDKLMEQLKVTKDTILSPQIASIPVHIGGPVDKGRGFMLHGHDFTHDETIRINDQFGVTGTLDALKHVTQGQGPDDMLFILGYAGWEAGQLDNELQQNAWLIADSHHDLVFKSENAEKWSLAVNTLGFDPAMLSSDAGRA